MTTQANRNDADNELVSRMDDKTFNQVAELVLKTWDDDVVELVRRKPMRERQSIRSAVAEYARTNGLFYSSLLAEVL